MSTRTPTWRWATVTQVNPLRIRLDSEAAALPITPDSLLSDTFVGERVWVQFYDKGLLVVGAVDQQRPAIRNNLRQIMSGGGVRDGNGTGVSWSKRLIMLGAGRDSSMPSGFFEMTMPPNGTVIPVIGHPSQTTATVASGLVPLSNWQQLWYDPPFGQTKVTDPSRYYITSYLTPFTLPPSWVPVVARNGDGVNTLYVWGDGRETAGWTTFTPSNGWVNYGSGYSPAQYRVQDGICYVQFMIKSGTTTNGTGITTLPVGARPATRLMMLGQSYLSPNVVACRVDVNSDGVISLQGGQTTSWVSFHGSFPVEQ